jgi:hypothetical protein
MGDRDEGQAHGKPAWEASARGKKNKYLHAVPVDYVMIWPQGFGGFDCQFERLKRLHSMAVVSRDVKRGVQGMALFGYSEK